RAVAGQAQGKHRVVHRRDVGCERYRGTRGDGDVEVEPALGEEAGGARRSWPRHRPLGIAGRDQRTLPGTSVRYRRAKNAWIDNTGRPRCRTMIGGRESMRAKYGA